MNITPHISRLLVVPAVLATGLLGIGATTASAAEAPPVTPPVAHQQLAIHGHWTTFTIELYPSDQRALINAFRSGGFAAAGGALCARGGARLAVICASGAQAAGGFVASEISDHYHPKCHLNLSIRYNGSFDRWWTSDCTK